MLGSQVRELIVRPAILALGLWSGQAEELLMFTWAHESEGGIYLKQVGGPALGIFDMEPETHEDLWDNYLKYQDYSVTRSPAERLIYDLRYAAQMCRLHYRRVKEKLPDIEVSELARYWGKYYQTESDPKKIKDAIDDYNRYVRGF